MQKKLQENNKTIFAALLTTLFMCLGFTGISQGEPPWEDPVPLVESHGRLAIGNRLHIVGHIGSNLVHRSSQDNGATWSSPNTIASASSNYPMQYGGLFALGDTVYLLTAAGDMGGQERQADFRKSIDNGLTWSSPVRITNNENQLRRARIVAYNNYVHVAGLGTSADGFVVYFRSTDGGATWAQGNFIAQNLGQYGGGQTIAVDGSTLYAPYTSVRNGVGGGDTYMLRSTDNGTTWGGPVLIGENSQESSRQARVQVMSVNDSAFVIWQREADSTGLPIPPDRLGFNRSTDGGATWFGPEILPDDSGVNREHQHIWLAAGGGVHVVWWDGGTEVGYKHSPDFGETWNQSEIAISASGSTVPFSIVADESWAHVLIGPQGSFLYARRPLNPVVGIRTELNLQDTWKVKLTPGKGFIQYRVITKGHVTLNIWNHTGRKEAELVNGHLQPGEYRSEWDSDNLSNGLYLIELNLNRTQTIRKVMIVR